MQDQRFELAAMGRVVTLSVLTFIDLSNLKAFNEAVDQAVESQDAQRVVIDFSWLDGSRRTDYIDPRVIIKLLEVQPRLSAREVQLVLVHGKCSAHLFNILQLSGDFVTLGSIEASWPEAKESLAESA